MRTGFSRGLALVRPIYGRVLQRRFLMGNDPKDFLELMSPCHTVIPFRQKLANQKNS